MSSHHSIVWAFLSAFLLLLPACGSDLADLCDDGCDCEGCSDREYEECVDDMEDIEREVEDEGCEAEMSEYASCLLDNAECHGNDYDIDYGDCDHEADDFYDCMD
jgi:hypothetical protein